MSHICIGSADSSKSGDIIDKMKFCMNEFSVNRDLGVWGEVSDDDYRPNIFYKEMSGSLDVGNKKSGGWKHEYKVFSNGQWITEGTKSALFHVSYSDKKTTGAEAGAGGRYNTSTVEEAGLLKKVREVHRSNMATTNTSPSPKTKYGTQIFLGTSGNMETIIGSKEMFTNPTKYTIVPYEDIWNNTGKSIGFFIPSYMALQECRDKNGNINFDHAEKVLKKIEKDVVNLKNPLALRMHRMNYPTNPNHMWIDNKGKILPSDLAELVVQKLEKKQLYKELGTPINLVWDSTYPNKVKYEININAEPFYEIRGWSQRDSIDGCIMMYEPPVNIGGIIPNDMYCFIGHDPYVSDEQSEGGSLGSTHVIMNPKYWDTCLKRSPLVATYIGKPYNGKEEYYQNQEKLLALYGNPTRGLWYEANRGQACRDYYLKKNKVHLLSIRPQRAVGTHIYEKRNVQYGWMVSNKVVKIQLIEMLRDWLLEEIKIGGKTQLILETLPCLFTLKQIAGFSLEEGNWDAVMSLTGAVLGIKEAEHFAEKIAKDNTRNKLSFLSNNRRLQTRKKHNFK